jgi:hypothetical protein
MLLLFFSYPSRSQTNNHPNKVIKTKARFTTSPILLLSQTSSSSYTILSLKFASNPFNCTQDPVTMDLTSGNIAFYLPWLLSEVATSCFVAMDLEMSGIALSVKYQGTKSLQKHYEENKAAAEKYQVLQVGLTICREDKERGTVHCLIYILFVYL